MQETVYQTSDAGVSPSESGCKSLSIKQRMQETLYQTADASLSIRQRLQEYLHQTADAGVSQSDS